MQNGKLKNESLVRVRVANHQHRKAGCATLLCNNSLLAHRYAGRQETAVSRCQARWKRGRLLISLPAQVVQHCCATLAPLQTVRLYAGISSPVGYRAMLRHFAILAGLASADQSERSRFTTAEWPAKAMRETSFNNDVFAAFASSSYI